MMKVLAVLVTWNVVTKTNKHMGEVKAGKLFDFVKLAKAVLDPNVGKTLLISLIYSFSFGLLIFAYQPFALKILNLTSSQVAFMFTIFGIVGFIAQALII